jgi:NDP-sugar pyrophosphorylase family protein
LKNISLIIPAAGNGTRFKDAGFKIPKPLISIKKIPMIIWVIENFKLTTLDEVFIIQKKVDNLSDRLKNYTNMIKPKINFITIDELSEGPALTVMASSGRVDTENSIIVANSDQYISEHLNSFTTKVRMLQNEGLILTMNASGNKWSYIKQNDEGFVTEIKEKVQISSEATVGVYAWSSFRLLEFSIKLMISANDRTNNEFYVAPSYNYLISNNIKVKAFNVGNHGSSVHGLGTPEDLGSFNLLDINLSSND